MLKSKSQFIMREDYLKMSDYIEAILFPIRYLLNYNFRNIYFKTFDFTDILKEQKVNSSIETIQPILIYNLFLRLTQKISKPKAIITWYENQNIDKAQKDKL